MTATTPPPLAADLTDGLKRLKMAGMRRLAPELLITAKTQRWNPEEFSAPLSRPRSPPGTPATPAPAAVRPASQEPGRQRCFRGTVLALFGASQP
jgi:hypothetical protein